MSCDFVHSLISRKTDCDKYIYSPKHFIEVVKKSRKNIDVQEITHKDIIIFDDKCVKSTKLKIFPISRIKQCEFLKDSYDIFVKFDHKKDYEKYDILRKNLKENLINYSNSKISYLETLKRKTEPIGISKAKSIVKNSEFIDNNYVDFYKTLKIIDK
jgi:hypothetical protein